MYLHRFAGDVGGETGLASERGGDLADLSDAVASRSRIVSRRLQPQHDGRGPIVVAQEQASRQFPDAVFLFTEKRDLRHCCRGRQRLDTFREDTGHTGQLRRQVVQPLAAFAANLQPRRRGATPRHRLDELRVLIGDENEFITAELGLAGDIIPQVRIIAGIQRFDGLIELELARRPRRQEREKHRRDE